MINRIRLLNRDYTSHRLESLSFLLLLCTFRRWKQCLLVTETWQIRARGEEKPFITKLELTPVFFFCSAVHRLVVFFCFLLALCTLCSLLCSTRAREPCRNMHFSVLCSNLVQTVMKTFPLGNPASPLLSVCPCLHSDADVYPPPHVDNQFNTLSFTHLVAWLGLL